MRIAQDLHFHVPRAHDELLEIHLVLAERALGLSARGRHRIEKPRLVRDDAHTAPAAAPARLEHDRQPHRARERERLGIVVRQRRRRGHHGDARARRKIARLDLVAELAHGVG